MAEDPKRGKRTPTEAPPERRLAAILAAGFNGCSHPMSTDNEATHRRISEAMDRLRVVIMARSGNIFSSAGTGLMAEFASATDALKCALGIQAESAREQAGATEPIRMAVTAGEILVGKRYMGRATIMLAARLERIAPPGGVALPGALYDQLRDTVPVVASPKWQPNLDDAAASVVVVSISAQACLAWVEGNPGARRRPPARPARDPRASLAVVPFRGAGNHEAFA